MLGSSKVPWFRRAQRTGASVAFGKRSVWRPRSAADSRANSVPLARLFAATTAVAIVLAPEAAHPVLGALPRQSAPLVVVLGYDHGPFPAGTRVPLERIMGGHVSEPDQGCIATHYHSAPCVGPPNVVVTICDVEGQTFGPFPDQAPCNCGHGVIDEFRFDVHVVSVATEPEIVSVGSPFFMHATLRNDGPDDVILDSLTYEVVEPNGNVIKTIMKNDIILPTGATVGPLTVSSDALTAFPTLRARVTTGTFNVRGCKGAGAQAVDSNPANNSGEAQVGVIPPDFGSVPKPVEDFVAPVRNPLDEVSVLPSPTPGVLGTSTHASTGTNRITFVHGDGTGGFAPTPFQIDGDFRNGVQVRVDDLNADGFSDVIVPDGENLRIVLGSSSGRAGRSRLVPVGGVPDGGIVAGDFDGDGAMDLATGLRGTPTGRISVVTGNGRDRFSPPVVTNLPGDPLGIAAGDFDRDGTLDIAAALSGNPGDSPGNVAVLLGDGTGRFAQSSNVVVGVRPVRLASGDLNGDGVPDLAIANAGSDSISIRLADGAGGLLPGIEVPVGENPIDLALGDFNDSGSLDIAVANAGSDRLGLLLGDGTGVFFNVPVRLGAGQGSVVALDANSDGKLDLAVGTAGGANERSALRILLNDAEPVVRPVITSAELLGTKTLVVIGEGFDTGTTILVDGVRQKTVADASTPSTRLTAKKGARKIASGQTVVVQVESATGVLSVWALFTRPS